MDPHKVAVNRNGLHSPSGVLGTREHNVSEAASLSVLRWEGGYAYSVVSLQSLDFLKDSTE
jgi:hypothetical protein